MGFETTLLGLEDFPVLPTLLLQAINNDVSTRKTRRELNDFSKYLVLILINLLLK